MGLQRLKRMGYFPFEGVNPAACRRLYGGTMPDDERDTILFYMAGATVFEQWMGWASSRMDGSRVGTQCMATPDGKWMFPEDWDSHYIRKHGLRPPQDFIDDAFAWVDGTR